MKTHASKPLPTGQPADLLTAGEVCSRLRVTRRTLERWVHLGQFPRPVRLGSRSIRWSAGAVQDYLSGLAQA